MDQPVGPSKSSEVVVLVKYRGFTVRVKNSCGGSHPYEWTLIPLTLKAKQSIRYFQPPSFPKKRHPYWDLPFRKARNPVKTASRVFDPTSMPTCRGRYSALSYGIDEVDYIWDGERYEFDNRRAYWWYRRLGPNKLR